jgi:dipeptidase D
MATQESALTGLEPRPFWAHFEAITKLARPSRHEEPIIEHIRAWAAEHGFDLHQDAGRNLAIRVPATAGRESAPVVILQGHLDMVCERNPDSPNDPAEGRIELVRDGEWLTADGTTLGADDGVAIAAMMALAEDGSLPHGPLELLMTVAEEVGLEGANEVDGSFLTGTIFMNLDSEEDGTLTVGCAGSTDTWIRIDAPRSAPSPDSVALGRANAIKLLGRVLREAHTAVPFRLVSLDGGKSRNAIPRDAIAVCSVPGDREEAFRSAVAKSTAVVQDAYKKTDPGVAVTVQGAADAADAWTDEATATLLDALALVPTGPLAMSPDFAGLVETSTSLGEAITNGGELTLHSLTRSSNDSAMPEVIATLDAAARLGGGEFGTKFNYNGWRPDLDSQLLAVSRAASERLFGKPPVVTAVHAGLESAVIDTKVDRHLDMLAIGPQIEGPHSPDERVSIPTVERFWQLLVAVVDDLSKGSE